MNIQLENTRVLRVELSCVPESTATESETSVKFNHKIGWVNQVGNLQNDFSVLIEMGIVDSQGLNIDIQFEGNFSTNDPVDEAFVKSHWPNVNGVAIVYPFLRAFISTLTVNAGFDPLILPSVNFQRIYNEQKAQEDLEN